MGASHRITRLFPAFTDNTLQVIFNAPDSKEANPTLNDRWLASYQQRMGR